MITGKCECGRVKYRSNGEVNDFSHCHCSQCRRMHGAAFASFAGVEKAGFSYLSGAQDIMHYASSSTHSRVFCRHCGSNILVELESEPENLYITLGTVEGNPNLPPGYHIYVGSKAPWYQIQDDLPRYETEPED